MSRTIFCFSYFLYSSFASRICFFKKNKQTKQNKTISDSKQDYTTSPFSRAHKIYCLFIDAMATAVNRFCTVIGSIISPHGVHGYVGNLKKKCKLHTETYLSKFSKENKFFLSPIEFQIKQQIFLCKFLIWPVLNAFMTLRCVSSITIQHMLFISFIFTIFFLFNWFFFCSVFIHTVLFYVFWSIFNVCWLIFFSFSVSYFQYFLVNVSTRCLFFFCYFFVAIFEFFFEIFFFFHFC